MKQNLEEIYLDLIGAPGRAAHASLNLHFNLNLNFLAINPTEFRAATELCFGGGIEFQDLKCKFK